MSYEDIYDACSKDGVLYAIPRSTGGYWQTLYYNADMAKELGLDLKQDMTIDEFIALKDTVNEMCIRDSPGTGDPFPFLILPWIH